jgi:hypothetical protein
LSFSGLGLIRAVYPGDEWVRARSTSARRKIAGASIAIGASSPGNQRGNRHQKGDDEDQRGRG